MINEERVKLMTKLSGYESGQGKEDLKIIRYDRKDYVSLHVVYNAIWITIGFFLLLAILGLFLIDYISKFIQKVDLGIALGGVIIFYVILLIIYSVYAHKYYKKKYNKAKEQAKKHYVNLKKLSALYEKEQQQAGTISAIKGEI